MNAEEKSTQKTQRNADLCAYYNEGHNARQCASKFRIARQRVIQILQEAHVWKPYVKNNRTQFLGVSVSEETKDALRVKADAEGKSVSRFASDVLDEVVR